MISDADMRSMDAAVERRAHHDAFVAAHPEYLQQPTDDLFARIDAMHRANPRIASALEARDVKHARRKYEAEPVPTTVFGELA